MDKLSVRKITYRGNGYYNVDYGRTEVVQDFYSLMETAENIPHFHDKLLLFERRIKLNKLHLRDGVKESEVIFEGKKPQKGFYNQLESKLMKK